MRVLGIDPGLTRCGMGVVDGSVGRPLSLVDVNVLRTSADEPVWRRLVTIEKGVDAWLDEFAPDAVNDLGDAFEVVSEPSDLVAVRTALQAAGIDYDSADASFVPDLQVQLDADGAGKVFRLIDALEDLDDVQNVYANFDVADEVMEQLDA